MPLEISLRNAQTLSITVTPQQILAARLAGDNRAYLSVFNKDAANTVMIAADAEYNSPSFSTASGGRPVYPQSEAWEQPGAVPGNAYWAWTLSGTALLNVQEG